MALTLGTPIASLPHVRPLQATLLAQELGIATYGGLLFYAPFRYEDRTQWCSLREAQAQSAPYVQCKGVVGPLRVVMTRQGRKLLMASFRDEHGEVVSLMWLRGMAWIRHSVVPHRSYLLFGKLTCHRGRYSVVHPELTPWKASDRLPVALLPMYHTTGKLTKASLDSRGLARLQRMLLKEGVAGLPENLSADMVRRHALFSRREAWWHLHAPKSKAHLARARYRLKFEETFFMQLQVAQQERQLNRFRPAPRFTSVAKVRAFYPLLPFALTRAQRRVIQEIYQDLAGGYPMYRLLQGDVGSGKTIVAFIAMLIPWAHGAQMALMVPTTLLAEQHHATLAPYARMLGLRVALLTGAISQRARLLLRCALMQGRIDLVIGTQVLLAPWVAFRFLGLVVVDEQHRFGVMQRAKLWMKGQAQRPHLLVMTATPIPRTLAMSCYNLASSAIDELPPDRQPVKTYHVRYGDRQRVLDFVRKQIDRGRQAYVVYPRIGGEGRYRNVVAGHAEVAAAFPDREVVMLHGGMQAAARARIMRRFAQGHSAIMVATTLIEVGLHVPNATVMVIEQAEAFGLAQLHQLRGRVGRGGEVSYAILMTADLLEPACKARIDVMVTTQDGFKVAAADLAQRGPGHLMGRRQSGFAALKWIDFAKDFGVIQEAQRALRRLMQLDPALVDPLHQPIRGHLTELQREHAPPLLG